jgi:hypothetical protein
MYPHRIRLLGPWECEPLAPPQPARRFVPPARLRDAGLADFAGRVRLVRPFGYPGRIDSYEHVWLTFADIAGRADIRLNDALVATAVAGTCEFEVTPQLAPRNRLEVMLDADSGDAGLLGEIALEIRRDAFLRDVRACKSGHMINVTGLVVGETSRPLELYTLADGRPVGYALVPASADGQPFAASFEAEAVAVSVRVELVCVAECWYAIELPAPQ